MVHLLFIYDDLVSTTIRRRRSWLFRSQTAGIRIGSQNGTEWIDSFGNRFLISWLLNSNRAETEFYSEARKPRIGEGIDQVFGFLLRLLDSNQ